MTGRASTTPGGGRPLGAFASGVAGLFYDRQAQARLHRGDCPRSGQPVWRNSYYVGQIEDRVWKPINGGSSRGGKRWTAALLKAAKKYELRTRAERRETEPGARNGELGEIGLAVLAFLYETVDYATGRLEPAVRTIAKEIGHSYSAVHRALERLRKVGFLQWMRRSEAIEDPKPGGPMVRQVSNAYALLCPPVMRGWLEELFKKAPAPECDEDRRKREKAEFETMLEALTAEERLTATWNGSTLLGETLRSVAAAVDRRERQRGESSTSDEIGGL